MFPALLRAGRRPAGCPARSASPSVAPGALGVNLNDVASHLENPDNTPTFYAFCVGVALVVALLFTAVADLFAGSGEDAKKSAAKKKEGKKAAKAKKTDETEPDDEPADDAEEDGGDGEEEKDEDEAPKTATKEDQARLRRRSPPPQSPRRDTSPRRSSSLPRTDR